MADDLTPEMAAYREAVAEALIAAWKGRSSLMTDYDRADAVLAVPNPEVERLRAEVDDLTAERDGLRSLAQMSNGCKCAYDDGPQQDCPVHGDITWFAAGLAIARAELDALRAGIGRLADGPDHHLILSAEPERSEVRMDGRSPYGLRYRGEVGSFALINLGPEAADRLRLGLAAQPHVSVTQLRALLGGDA